MDCRVVERMWRSVRTRIAVITMGAVSACAAPQATSGAAPGLVPDETSDGSEAVANELVLRGGRVMDPETGTDAVLDVAIAGGKIVAISPRQLNGRRFIDVSGQVVAPGFIDLHAHGQDRENYQLRAADGVTTALELEVGTARVGEFYAEREGKTLIHFGASVGHIPVRMAVMGDTPGFLPAADSRAATVAASEVQLKEIRRRIAQGLDAGALAVGLGIQYTPAATRWEIQQVFHEAARRHASVHVHLRHNGVQEPESSTNALQEALSSAMVSGAPLHVVHLHSTSLAFTERHLQMITLANKHGLDVTTECYPYTAGMTDIASGVFNPGWQASLGIGYEDLLWAETGERLTEETFNAYRKRGGFVAVFSIPDTAIEAALTHPLAMVASDAVMKGGNGHPRSAATNGRFLGHYVREQKLLSLMEALRKITLMPAQRLERWAPVFKRKGRVQVGADADLTIFNPVEIQGQATWAKPTLPTRGISFVLVDGVPVVEQGALQAELTPGRGLRGGG